MAQENGTHPRRSFLKGAAGVLGLGFWADETLDALPQNTNTSSKPSDLKITVSPVLSTLNRVPGSNHSLASSGS